MATKRPFWNCLLPKVNQVIADIAEQICQIKKGSDGNFSWNALTSFSSLVTIVIKGLMIWGSKCHQNNSSVVCHGYEKYKEAEVDRLVAILKTNNCGGGSGPCGIH